MKPVPNFPGYFADESGNIYSNRLWKTAKSPQKMVPYLNQAGYLRIRLRRDGKHHERLVHQIILETFVGPRPKGMESCHGPKGRRNNSLSNLCWGTRIKNLGTDKVRDGTANIGEQHPQARLNGLQIRIIRQTYKPWGHGGLTQEALAAVFHVPQVHISRIVHRKAWSNIP